MAEAARDVRRGDNGAAVYAVQRLLGARGWRVALDGIFGAKTEAAVRTFQAQAALRVTGVVNGATYDALNNPLRVRQVQQQLAAPRLRAGLEIELGDLRAPRARERLLAVNALIDYLGCAEDPPGSNEGPEINDLVHGYREHWRWPPGEEAPPWCAIAVSSAIKIGTGAARWQDTPMGDWFGGAWQYEAWAEAGGLVAQHPKAGQVFTMARSASSSDAASSESLRAGHVGFIVCPLPVAGFPRVLTVEGNVHDGVVSRSRRVEDLEMLIDWWAA